MPRFYSILLILVVAGCSSPGLRYGGIEPMRMTARTSVFDVYVSGENVRAIRINRQILPKASNVFADAWSAIELATKCKVVDGSLTGDQAVMDAKIKC